ncbi:relaxase/mobilization nuclease domain-containing protein [Chitinophaga rhizophila]|uniref:Relaxase/mobilization nuclease domain-containing protein n=1 Tax=Chitinophaga rhizophila TaxID=2866212 RepID=A0ABS7G712_9BACT|nr:relaxase/mobilization nuclease domain-containing protein [Chitinophaga rhizophila]MBW8683434.1 relaxase/mobilization nuclease domain-containing protein [Chitinophaga rhizophila]
MVARINQGEVIRGAVEYNERKVSEGKATLIHAENFLKDTKGLSFSEKLGMLEKLASLNDKRDIKCVHISLNFDPSEKPDINDEAAVAHWHHKVTRIATEYMEQIGFKGQPFLIYEHNDAAHPHIHIVTTNIKPDRTSVDLRWIGKLKSEPARKALEVKYNLVKATKKDFAQHNELPAVNIAKVVYGEVPTKKAIGNVVGEVVRAYNFTSLAEYNEILKQYNIVAYTGPEGSKMQEKKGLVYYVTDSLGNRIGKGIKASSLYKKPTISNLEKTFANNKKNRANKVDRTKAIINRVLVSPKTTSRKSFVEQLRNVGIKAVFKDTKDGRAYGLTFIDNKNRIAIKGSDLGNEYSVNAVTAYLINKAPAGNSTQNITGSGTTNQHGNAGSMNNIKTYSLPDLQADSQERSAALEIFSDLLRNDNQNYQPDPYKKKKRKKKKGLHL